MLSIACVLESQQEKSFQGYLVVSLATESWSIDSRITSQVNRTQVSSVLTFYIKFLHLPHLLQIRYSCSQGLNLNSWLHLGFLPMSLSGRIFLTEYLLPLTVANINCFSVETAKHIFHSLPFLLQTGNSEGTLPLNLDLDRFYTLQIIFPLF